MNNYTPMNHLILLNKKYYNYSIHFEMNKLKYLYKIKKIKLKKISIKNNNYYKKKFY